MNQYAYSLSEKGVYFNLYGGNTLNSKLKNSALKLTQTTDYPWDGKVSVSLNETPKEEFSMFFRIPG